MIKRSYLCLALGMVIYAMAQPAHAVPQLQPVRAQKAKPSVTERFAAPNPAALSKTNASCVYGGQQYLIPTESGATPAATLAAFMQLNAETLGLDPDNVSPQQYNNASQILTACTGQRIEDFGCYSCSELSVYGLACVGLAEGYVTTFDCAPDGESPAEGLEPGSSSWWFLYNLHVEACLQAGGRPFYRTCGGIDFQTHYHPQPR